MHKAIILFTLVSLLHLNQTAQADIFSDEGSIFDEPSSARPLPPLKAKSYAPFKPTKHTGTTAFTIKADYVEPFSDGLGMIKIDGKYGFINKTGHFAIKPSLKRAKPFNEGLAAVLIGDKWGYINKQGKIVIKPQFVSAEAFHEGMAGVRPDRNHPDCYINTQGKIQFCSDAIISIFPFSEGLARIRRTLYAQSGFIDQQGNVVIPEKFDHAGVFHEGLVRVRKNRVPFSQSQYGFANRQGKVVIPIQYDDVTDFNDGLAAVQVGEKWGFINRQGEMVIQPQYDNTYGFSEGLAMVEQNGKEGFIDQTGKVVIPIAYFNVEDFSNGLAKVTKTPDAPDQFIDRTGKVHFELINAEYPAFADGLYIFPINNKQYRYIRSQ